jgi:hypothetical protein
MYVCIYFSDYIVIIDYILDYNIFASYCVLQINIRYIARTGYLQYPEILWY